MALKVLETLFFYVFRSILLGPQLAEGSHQLEEAVTELATLVHCHSERRRLRLFLARYSGESMDAPQGTVYMCLENR